MAKTHFWVGLDVGVDITACCVVDDNGGVAFEQKIPTSAVAIKTFLRPCRRRVSLIGVEAGNSSIHLARSLIRLGFAVSVFDTRQVSKYLKIRQNKTDRNDARGLAEIARTGHSVVSQIYLRTSEIQHLRSTLVMRQRLVRMRVGGEGAIRSLIRLHGGKLKAAYSAASLHLNVLAEVSRIKRSEKIDLRPEVEPILKLCENLRLYLENSESELLATAKRSPECQRFMEIPGIGPICALSFFSAIGEPFRFKRNADVGAYLGMTPIVRQSGRSSSSLRISKMGSRMTRAHLVTAAGMHLRLADSSLRDWGLALQERVGSRSARVAVARKLAVVMLAMWKSGRNYEPRPSAPDFPAREETGLETVTTTRAAIDPEWDAGPSLSGADGLKPTRPASLALSDGQ